MFRELIEKDIRNRGTIVPVGSLRIAPTPHLRYCSLFMFGADIEAYVKVQKSVKGFKGKVYSEAVWIDVDYDKDVNEARLSTIEVVKRLNADYGIDPDSLFIYFSGKKGFHVAIHNNFIGFTHTTPVEPEKMKAFVAKLTQGIPHIDFVIYEPVRIFRMENSLHEKSGLYKIRISFTELQAEMEDIRQLAKHPRTYPFKTNIATIKVSEPLKRLWADSGAFRAEQRDYEYKGNLFAAPTEGSRNKTLLVQACTLFRKSELSAQAVLDIISNAAYIANIGAKDQVDAQELKRIVQNAERLVGEERKKPAQTVEDELQMRSFGEWLPEWESYIMQEQTDFTFLFYELNKVLTGRFKGHMLAVMGYGGAKKSLYALNLALINMRKTDGVFLYSTMEMSVPQLINRIVDHEVKSTDGRNAHLTVTSMMRRDLNEGRQFMTKQLAEVLGNRLQIISNSRMTYEGYKAAIKKCRETIGAPAVLIVDGLSMMGGKGSETELYSQNSADLKQLANEENILVVLICHVSKGAEKHTRDLSRNIRGSEKILDNCDYYMTMSQVQDESMPDKYRQDIGFINFVDKRGTGMSIDVVYSFDAARLQLNESMLDPVLFLEPVKKKEKKEHADF